MWKWIIPLKTLIYILEHKQLTKRQRTKQNLSKPKKDATFQGNYSNQNTQFYMIFIKTI